MKIHPQEKIFASKIDAELEKIDLDSYHRNAKWIIIPVLNEYGHTIGFFIRGKSR